LVAALALVHGCGGRARNRPPPGAVLEAGTTTPRPDRGVIIPLDTYQPPGKDQYIPPPKKDRGPPPACTKLGNVCKSSTSCCPGTSCVLFASGLRLCLAKCTPDNPQTPLVNEDDCHKRGPGLFCSNVGYPGKRYMCLQKCEPKLGSSTCPAGVACHPRSATMSGSITTAVCAWAACKTSRDCPVWLHKTCTTQGSSTQCSGLPKGSICTMQSPNAAPGAAALRCAMPGVCDVKSGLCAPHKYGKASAKVGDPCKDDRWCGGQMRCDMQGTNAQGYTHARNGYCVVDGCAFSNSLTPFACPSNARCHRLYYGGRCFKSCDLKSSKTCRGYAGDKYGDYECRAWNNLSVGGTAIVSGPVCETGDLMPCDMLSGSSLDCSSVGLQSNPTQMKCRDPKTGKQRSKYDPKGYCLDSTGSGK